MVGSVRHWTRAEPRAGSGTEEYEDAVAVSTDDWPVRAAVADGATESVFAGTWARILVDELVTATALSDEVFERRLADARSAWRADVADRVHGRPWYVAAKATDGAFATVLGLSVQENGHWRALCVGDCCLFHVREGRTEQSWPLTSPDAFGNRPALLSSQTNRERPPVETTSGSWRSGDLFVLATDALAEWLFTQDVAALAQMRDDPFRETIEAARQEGRLRNDDVTLLALACT